uniref:Uncharacterized protein n=1 Tax=Entomoneis paludosa TaxID=265537 RepID=A0A7S3DRR0_9STRA
MTSDTNDPPAADPSHERTYGNLFPLSQHVVQVNQIGVSFAALRSLFPERVLFSRLNGIFWAWEQGHETLPSYMKVSVSHHPPTGGFNGQRNRVVLYDYDNYTY